MNEKEIQILKEVTDWLVACMECEGFVWTDGAQYDAAQYAIDEAKKIIGKYEDER